MTALALLAAAVVTPAGVARRPIYVAGGRVVPVRPPGCEEVDLRDHLIFPGLVNAHDHLQLNNVPALPAGGAFANSYEWIAALGPHLKTTTARAATAVPVAVRHWQGGLKNLLGGATTVAHHDPWHPVLDDTRFPVGLLADFGWCHSLGLAPTRRAPILRLAASLFGRQEPGQVGRYGPGVVDSFSKTPRDRPWIIHLAEGRDQVAGGELAELGRLGCLGPNTVIVHGVGLGPDDVRAVVGRGAAVVWCPASNLALLGTTLDPRPLFEAGRLALGSDARLTGSRDLLDELRVAADHGDLTPAELLRLATLDGSRILRLPEVGGLEPGQRADLLVVRDGGGDPNRGLLSVARADLAAVVRGGAPAVADPDFAAWFGACAVETVPALLDGRPKLLARAIADPDAVGIEPGLALA